MQIWALIVDSFRDVIDRKIFWIMVILSVSIAGAMACMTFDQDGINILFGTWHIGSEKWSTDNAQARANVGALLVKVIADLYIGWVGMVLALISTSGMFPAFMAPGAVDTVVSKPMSRHMLFLGKYAGAMVFVFLQALLFVGLTFLVIGLRWHYWLWGYLWLIPLMVVLFSYLFSFCALFGVLTRSALASLLLTMLAWIVMWMPQSMYGLAVTFEEQIDPHQRWQHVLRTINWAVPKTQDIPLIAGDLVNASLLADIIGPDPDQLSQDDARDMLDARAVEKRVSNINAFSSIGSSLASEAVIVALAMFLFKRRDF